MTENKKYEKGTLGWLREQQKIKAQKDGFDNIDDWLKWKTDPFNVLEKKYGKEFADWAMRNEGRVPKHRIDTGCKTQMEYKNKKAQELGFKDYADVQRKYRHETGKQISLEDNEDCSAWFGEFTENLMIHRYPEAKKMPYNNKGFDYLWNGIEINSKGRCLIYRSGGSSYWNWNILFNNNSRKFTLSGWDNRESLNPMYAWEFDRDDIVRGEPFWKRYGFSITNTSKALKEFEEYQIDISWLKELCRSNDNINRK